MHDRLNARDPYACLGVTPDATRDEITAAYRRLVRSLHPDLAETPTDPTALQAVISAHRLLIDPEQRQSYDRSGKVPTNGRTRDARRPCPNCRGTRIVQQPCRQCAGRGTYLSPGRWLREAIRCTSCHGHGFRPTMCQTCGATGIVEHRH